MSKLTLEALEVLDAIDRKGSFAAAAAALYRVPSAITYSVQKLEEDLGVELFRKEGRRSVLTQAGKVLLEQGRELLEAAERLVETTRQVDRGWESCLNIAIDSILNFNLFHPLLTKFYQLKPDIEINLHEEVLGGTWEAIISGRADLAVGAIEPPNNAQGLRFHPLLKTQWVFAVAKDHPLSRINRALEEKDVLPFRTVVVRDSSRQLPPLTRRILNAQATLSVPTMLQKIEAQAAGLGVGFLPAHAIRKQLSRQELIALPMAGDNVHSVLHLGWKANNKGKALLWFIDQLTNHPISL